MSAENVRSQGERAKPFSDASQERLRIPTRQIDPPDRAVVQTISGNDEIAFEALEGHVSWCMPRRMENAKPLRPQTKDIAILDRAIRLRTVLVARIFQLERGCVVSDSSAQERIVRMREEDRASLSHQASDTAAVIEMRMCEPDFSTAE